MSRAGGFKTLDPSGKSGIDGGPQFKDTYHLSVGKSINESAFVTFLLPYLSNRKNGEYKTSTGDPIFSLRWTALMPNIAEPLVPQVQLLFSYKYALARSLYDSQYPRNLLDVFGNGFSETRIGLDVFWGMREWKYGFAHTLQMPTARYFPGAHVELGLGMRSTVLVGFGQTQWGKVLMGLNREQRDQTRTNGELVSQSESFNYSLFTTADWIVAPLDAMIRATVSRRGLEGFHNQNTGQSVSVTLAWMQALQ